MMTLQPAFAFAWNPAIGIPMLVVGVIVLGLIWLFGQPRKEQGKRRIFPGQGSERREPSLGESPTTDEPSFGAFDAPVDEPEQVARGRGKVRPSQGELDMGLRAELEKLGATLAGERSTPSASAPSGAPLPKPSGQAASIVDALRAPSGSEPTAPHIGVAQKQAPVSREPAHNAPAEPPRSDLGRRPAQLPVERIVTLFLMARDGGYFSGPDLVVAAEKAGLEFGDMGIYHRLLDGKRELGPIFSVANMLKPGNFDLTRLDTLRTPGLSFFMTLPGPLSALDAWDAMLPTAQRLAELLDSQVLDEERNALGRQRIAHIRDELRGWDRDHEGKEIIFGR
jgi:cell division protein ZipA